jgi:hypothetical protein
MSGVDKFAGSATGVHFIHSAEQKYLQVSSTATAFAESIYKLHTLSQPISLYSRKNSPREEMSFPKDVLGIPLPKRDYLIKVERFFRRWGSTYPILSPKQYHESTQRVFDQAHGSNPLILARDSCSFYQLYLILAINAWDDPESDKDLQTDNSSFYFNLAQRIHLQSIERGDTSTLQSLLLLSLYLQLSGQHSRLTQVSGEAVRLAQSLGLHRHTRRFKFCAGEIEMRNRIWWAVHRLDMYCYVIGLCVISSCL